MKKLLLILLCFPFIGFGQGWEVNIGNPVGEDEGRCVKQTIDGGYIVAGWTWSSLDNYYATRLIKTDVLGNVIWDKEFDGDNGSDVLQTFDGGYIIACESDTNAIIRTDNSGNLLWSKSYISDYGFIAIQQTSDSGFILVGDTFNILSYSNILLLKLDADGNEQWLKVFGDSTDENALDIELTNDNGFLVTATKGFGNLWYIKLDGNGDTLWTTTFSNIYTVDSELPTSKTSDNGFITTACSDDGEDLILLKIDSVGNQHWFKTIDKYESEESGCSVSLTLDGGFIISGFTHSDSLNLGGAWVVKTDSFGFVEWDIVISGIHEVAVGYSIEQTNDGGYIMSGRTKSSETYLCKIDVNGNVTSTFNIPINPNRKIKKIVDVLGKQTKPKTNTPFIEIYDDGTVEKRIVIE